MTHEHTAQAQPSFQEDWLGWARRPGFHPAKLVTVVAGFAIFPPLGVAALLYFLWANRRHAWHHKSGDAAGAYRTCGGRHRGWHRAGHMGERTGNAAFDAHREAVLKKLDEERDAFQAFRAAERAKRDKAAYDAFRAAETQDQASHQAQDQTPDGDKS